MATLPATAAPLERPRLSAGLELVGRYRDSGFRDAPYLVRHGDGRFAQLPELLYAVAEHADGRHTVDAIARAVGRRIGRAVSAGNVELLLGKLRDAGIVGSLDGAPADAPRVDPLLALRFRAAVVPAGATRLASTVLRPLFLPVVVVAALAALLTLDAWLYFDHGVAQSVRQIVLHPVLLLAVLGLVVLGTLFHELGHATACRYGGARPGVMGVGLYLVWPAFYTDVTDAYRLGRAGRLRTDLGGVYFNALYALAAGAAVLATGAEFLLAVVMVQHVQILQQLLPWGRLDGYYVLTDLTGVPDMLSRVRPVLRGPRPGGGDAPRVRALKPWVRAVASVYVLTLVPMMALTIALLVVGAPRVVVTAVESFRTHLDAALAAARHGQPVATALAGVQAVALVTPALGTTLMALGVARRLTAAAARRSPALAVAAASLSAAVVAASCLLWWPTASPGPIGPAARGTVDDGVSALNERVGGPVLRTLAPASHGDTSAAAARTGASRASSPARAAGATPASGAVSGSHVTRAGGARTGASRRRRGRSPARRRPAASAPSSPRPGAGAPSAPSSPRRDAASPTTTAGRETRPWVEPPGRVTRTRPGAAAPRPGSRPA